MNKNDIAEVVIKFSCKEIHLKNFLWTVIGFFIKEKEK